MIDTQVDNEKEVEIMKIPYSKISGCRILHILRPNLATDEEASSGSA